MGMAALHDHDSLVLVCCFRHSHNHLCFFVKTCESELKAKAAHALFSASERACCCGFGLLLENTTLNHPSQEQYIYI